eukprot:gene11617-biopygen5638
MAQSQRPPPLTTMVLRWVVELMALSTEPDPVLAKRAPRSLSWAAGWGNDASAALWTEA